MCESAKKFLFYKNLLENDFFEDVTCFDKNTKNCILEWMFYLKKYHGITIEKFSYLFSKYTDIKFPIVIVSNKNHKFKIIDDLENEYYCLYISKMCSYSIGKRDYPFDKEIVYLLSEENTIKVIEMSVLRLNSDTTYKSELLSFYYDYENETTTVIFEKEEYIVEIIYSIQNPVFEEKLLGYFFKKNWRKIDFHDVFEVFVNIRNVVKSDKLSIKSMGKSKILSEIYVANDILKKYSYTEKENGFEVSFHKLKTSKSITEFILSRKK